MPNVCRFPCCAHRKAWIQVPEGGVSSPRIFIHTCCSRASLRVVADGSDEGDLGKKHQGGKLNIVNLLQGVFWGKVLTAVRGNKIQPNSELQRGVQRVGITAKSQKWEQWQNGVVFKNRR